MPDSASLDISSAITMAAWVKPEAAGTQNLIKKSTNGGTNGYELSLSALGAASSQRAFVRFNQATSGDTYRVNATTMYPSHGTTWMHVAATYDGTTIRLYVNGVQEGQLAASIPIPTNNLALGIGAQPDGLFGVLQGTMDDVLLYNTALTASEIAALAAAIPPAIRCSWAPATLRALGRTIRPRAAYVPVFPGTCSRSETTRTRPARPPVRRVQRRLGRLQGTHEAGLGNHDFGNGATPGATPYFDYFNGVGNQDGPAGDRALGYYSYNIGSGPSTWHVVVLNSECEPGTGYWLPGGCAAGSAQDLWLKNDLATAPTNNIIAIWHKPRWASSGNHTHMQQLWQDLYDGGADVLLGGHWHNYERLAPWMRAVRPTRASVYASSWSAPVVLPCPASARSCRRARSGTTPLTA